MAVPAFEQVLESFPAVQAAFGYGSGIFQQPRAASHSAARPMLDFIFAVRCPLQWHREVSTPHIQHG